jgi:peroxiredoxin
VPLTLARTLSLARNVLPVLIACAAVALLVQNFIVLRENRDLRSRQSLPFIVEGARVRELAGLSLDGAARRVALPVLGSRLLVIAYSPGCPFCRANQSGWMSLERQLKQRGWNVIWLSRDPIEPTRDYCLKVGIPESEVLAEPSFRTYYQFGLEAVPNTMVVGPGGTVEKLWSGELRKDSWLRLSEYFGLGGITSQSRGRASDASMLQSAPALANLLAK